MYLISSFLNLVQSDNFYSEAIFLKNLNIFQVGFISVTVIIFTMSINVLNLFVTSKMGAILGTEITFKTFKRLISTDWIIQTKHQQLKNF